MTDDDPPSGAAPTMDGPPLALLTVTHESERALKVLLDSVERHLPAAEVVVVDCASLDGSAGVARHRRSVTTRTLDQNIGFGRACNIGLQDVRAPVTLLINPDAELIDDSPLVLAAQSLRTDVPERLLAPLVLSPGGSRQDTVHPIPASPPDLARALVPPAFAPPWARPVLAPWTSPSPRRVGWAVGCALAGRTATLRRLGPFDESIFLYAEDLELCLRAAEQGVETWFWPGARVLHYQTHSSSRAFGGEPFDRLARARHDVVARRLGMRRARLDDASQALTFASRILVKTLLGRTAARERQQLRALFRQLGPVTGPPRG